MTYQSHLYYGGPNAGKTWALVTAFWDPDTKKQIRDGRLLLFGREDNPALLEGIPDKLVKRFVSPIEKPLSFVAEFSTYMRAALASARSGGPEVYGMDGLSEWNFVYMLEHATAYGISDKWAGWRAAKDQFLGLIQMLHPNELKAHVLATARVASKKKDTPAVEGDPDWVDSKYFPAMDGWMRDHVSHYFNLVSYVDEEFALIKGADNKTREESVHRYYMKGSTQFLVKNVWQREWRKANMPDYLTNPKFDDIMKSIEDAQAKAAQAGKPSGATAPANSNL